MSISIHAPLTGSDNSYRTSFFWTAYFNPRSPYGERLPVCRDGRDFQDFNPRSPYGERQVPQDAGIIHHVFQSTLPLRGATIALARGYS